ncbi:MAG: sensor histidine kinase [Cognatishimia sp.]|uniref:sensor histidine kinase n=1 Tax=Cognatishimia sp. TaxID=2211648 RepID=UPI003B8CD919
MRRAYSLRLRLFTVIVTPLIIMSILLGYWRFTVAQNTAEELFDRSLLAAALAISRDITISGGDALSPSTRQLVDDAAGGEVFYHATGPGGIYVTGYAYPPSLDQSTTETSALKFFEADYRGEDVRVLRVTERTTIEGITGDSTATVWQRVADRNSFARELATRAAALMGGLLLSLSLLVWFGVHLGLRPLADLQDAIAMRSPDDLSRIKRAIPEETKGIVSTLNRLFDQVERSFEAQQTFISNAAHQLRNPAAAVQSMAEAVKDAKDDRERDQRVVELIAASRQSAKTAVQLLSLDRLKQPAQETDFEPLELRNLLHSACADMGPQVLAKGLEFELKVTDQDLCIKGDEVYLMEAVKNLIDNAMIHGGESLSQITVTLKADAETASITVEDDGKGLNPDQSDAAFSRFSQVGTSSGSGLGLAIVASVAERHNGQVKINGSVNGASVTLVLSKC